MMNVSRRTEVFESDFDWVARMFSQVTKEDIEEVYRRTEVFECDFGTIRVITNPYTQPENGSHELQ